MDSKSLLRAAQEPAFVLLDRVWYCCVVPVQPAGFVNKAQGFLLTSGLLQEPCCALVALKLVAFLVLFGIRVFSALPRKSAPVCCVCVCDVKPTRRESCRMSLLSQDVCDYIPLLSHCWPPRVSHATLLPVTILYVLLVPSRTGACYLNQAEPSLAISAFGGSRST